jgi:hypothetical protein
MATDTAAVTVVVPTFARPAYLEQAIRSVVAQDWSDWQLTVYDDGGLPQTRAVIESFADARISHHVNISRLGVGGNKLAGWQAVTTRYFANLDDDDVWEPRFLSTLVPALAADETVAIAFGSQRIIDERGEVDENLTEATEGWYRGQLAPGRHWPIGRLVLVDMSAPIATGSVIRRSAVDWSLSPSSDNILVDYWLGYLIVRSGGAAYFQPEPLARYRAHGGSASATSGLAWHTSCAECYAQFARDPALASLRPIFRERLAASEIRAASMQVIAGDMRSARATTRRALAAALTPTTVGLAIAAHSGALGRRAVSAWMPRYDPSARWLAPPAP